MKNIQSTKIKITKIPRHVAIIMDGNRRWAFNHRLLPWKGHKAGKETVEKIIRASLELDISYLTLWGSSLDNIAKRSRSEIKFLFELFQNSFKELARDKDIHTSGVSVNVFGRWRELFPPQVKKTILEAIEKTKNYQKHFLNFMLAYSGTDEMLFAIQNIAKLTRANPDLKIDASLVKKNLFTCDFPSIDYLIRTGGNPHLSTGFMMWDTADAQLYFSEKLWPDFTPEDYKEAIAEYGRRMRKFGA